MNKQKMKSEVDWLGAIAVGDARDRRNRDDAMHIAINLAQELDERPKMPAFFKKWTDGHYGDICAQLYFLAKVAYSGAYLDDEEVVLKNWINRDPWCYQICVDAIVNGFEVEDE